MSEYGRIWEDIRLVRGQLADALGESSASLTNLEMAIRKAALHNKEVMLLLAKWSGLEARAAKLDPETGNP